MRDLHAYAISLLGDRAAAEDVTALAFERLYRSRGRLDLRRGTPRAWLFAIARNAALDELRSRARASRALPKLAPIVQPQDDEDLESVERRATVRAALLRLAPRERESICSNSMASSPTAGSLVCWASADRTPARVCTAP